MKLLGSYAYRKRKSVANEFRLGEGIIGQCALEKERIILNDVPGDYVKINSGLGEAAPTNIVALPVLFEGQIKAVIELASFQPFSENHFAFLDQLTESIGIVINTIEANMRTEELLKQSQSLAQELQLGQAELQETNRRLELQAQSLQTSEELLKQQQEELQQTNQELEEKAQLLSEQKNEVEQKNRQIELARTALEDKAKQLALSSKYKSEFLANMSHELRTPLNSMLILSKMLSENPEGYLGEKQIEFAEHDPFFRCRSAGADQRDPRSFQDRVRDDGGRDRRRSRSPTFGRTSCGHSARSPRTRAFIFRSSFSPACRDRIHTDVKRLRQVLKNLLSNAFKFTEFGEIDVKVGVAESGWSPDHNT